ncbi:MAG: hypothetical protein AAF694_25005, partial [Bacteroidota bacterium]
MQRIWNKALPNFLQRGDQWLLRKYPLIWRTQVHYVLLGGLVLGLLFFLIGLLTPQDGQSLNIEPIHPIVIHQQEGLYFIYLMVVLLIIWAYQQYKKGLPKLNARDTLITLAAYALGTFILLGVTAPAYRLG